MASVGLEEKVIIDHETLFRPTPAEEKKKQASTKRVHRPARIFQSSAHAHNDFIQDVENSSSSVLKNSYLIVVVHC